MQDPLRVVFIEDRQENHGIAAQVLSDHHLDFRWQRAASAHELTQVAEDFKPHIVLCTKDVSANSKHGLVDALRLLCSQTPQILVTSVCDERTAVVRPSVASVSKLGRIVQDPADLRRGFAGVLESSAAAAVISNAEGWITHANTRACRLLESSARSLITVMSAAQDQSPPMPHWLPGSTSQHCHHRLAYFDSWSLLPTLVHMDDLIGCLTAPRRDYRAALAVIALDRDSGRILHSDPAIELGRYGSIIRISADDFLVVLPDPIQPAEAAMTVQRLVDSIAHPRSFPGARPATPARAPATAAAAGDSSVQHRRMSSLRAPADAHRAEHGRLDTALGEAVQQHSLSVQFQPQFDVKTGRGCGVEALARWMLGSGENVAPSVFIPVAERSGLIHDLGAWMLRSACETAYPWCSRDAQRTTLSVNVSPLQIDGQFSEVIGRTLERIGFPAKQLELEITESALIANPEATIEYLKEWKQMGVRIAMDDFGTGYSSLSYLSRLPVDRLKLDQSLVHRMTQDRKTAAVTRLIVSLGAELGIDVIAEGVETEEQLQMLTDLECPRVQGYLFGRPMPAKQAHLALRKAWGNRPSTTSAMAVSHA
jgi:EAL domain-containing protein (putative c-di-GMP-specific phosphodiesterase class I)